MEIPRNIKRKAKHTKHKLHDKLFSSESSSAVLLHGLLHIKIIKCTNLRNFDRVGNLFKFHKKDKSDPYVNAYLEDYRLIKTRHIDDELNPVFDEEFYVPVAHM